MRFSTNILRAVTCVSVKRGRFVALNVAAGEKVHPQIAPIICLRNLWML